MKNINLPWILALMVLAVSCSPRNTTPPALPESWYKAPEQNGGAPVKKTVPGPEFDSRVVATFQAHTDALGQVSEPESFADGDSGGLKKWTPWHLDGMVANFTIDIGGIFGALMGEGVASVKGIWKQQRAPEKHEAVKLKKPATVKFNAKMTSKDVPGLMEPVVRAASATRSVEDKARLRRNLTRKGQQFLTLARALNRVENRRAWKVEGAELQLSFDARGQISPSVGVGGTFTVYLEWDREDDSDSNGFAESFADIDDSPIYRNLNQFTDLMASMIPEFRAESAAIRRYGFDFTEFQVGIAITAGGDIGIAALTGSISGKLKFIKAGYKESHFTDDVTDDAEVPPPPDTAVLKIIGPPPDAERQAFIAANNIRTQTVTRLWDEEQTATIFEAASGRFREGMRDAVSMGTYFASKARSADTSKWQISHLEVEFDAGITGDLKVVTIGGQGQMVLGFDRL